jgi:hypothetical protein
MAQGSRSFGFKRSGEVAGYFKESPAIHLDGAVTEENDESG